MPFSQGGEPDEEQHEDHISPRIEILTSQDNARDKLDQANHDFCQYKGMPSKGNNKMNTGHKNTDPKDHKAIRMLSGPIHNDVRVMAHDL
eukprot:CAMPEP_0180829478 /NCGR_PEP_ID=MMETSP1038_2-20121128/75281_1 /TAXON_ID=632150 /ORGANISM="Azadinium spinosum, Strain 3D9" /LENGTH=89 /DNA_ID=CAMNT_0022872521 /DNA_START=149 /DNA_END=418 /DNA_ORIENTATION=+